MGVLFLDIDGVLATHTSFKNAGVWKRSFIDRGLPWDSWEYWRRTGDPSCISCLNQITRIFPFPFVICSSWRLSFSLDEIKRVFTSWGVEGEIQGVTEVMGSRGEEVWSWLQRHPQEQFLILDDCPNMYEESPQLSPFIVQTSWGKGLETHHVEEVERIISVSA